MNLHQRHDVENGQQRTVKQAGGQPITMYSTPGGGAEAASAGETGRRDSLLPSRLRLGSDGASFSVTRTNRRRQAACRDKGQT